MYVFWHKEIQKYYAGEMKGAVRAHNAIHVDARIQHACFFDSLEKVPVLGDKWVAIPVTKEELFKIRLKERS